MSNTSIGSAVVTVAVPGAPVAATSGRVSTYGQILKSTALIGGSSVVNIGFSIIRTKLMAVLLGPAGVGLMGLYSSIVDLVQSLAGMGVSSSGVRQIAEAVGSGDEERIARTVTVLRRVSLGLGLVGAGLVLLLATPISLMTFGTPQQAALVGLLSVVVFFRVVSVGQGALVQGMRRIGDLARMSVLAGLYATVITIPLVYFFREQGIVPALIGISATALLTSWWYSRKLQPKNVAMTLREVGREASGLMKLGLAFLASAFLTMGAAYAIRLIVLRLAGVEAAGLYQAAWAVGGLYVGFILQAMGSDFYPRLTAVAQDNAECNRLVNEQAQISLLLAGPGVIGTLTLAPLVIGAFYSAAFAPAVDLLRWICLGMTLRVVAFPMGYIVLAKGAQRVFFMTDVAATLVHVTLAWLLVRQFGVNGAGAAFFGLYAWHAILVYVIARRMTGFEWSADNRRLALVMLPATGLVFVGFDLLPSRVALSVGGLVTGLTAWYAARQLLTLVPVTSVPPAAVRWLQRFGLLTG